MNIERLEGKKEKRKKTRNYGVPVGTTLETTTYFSAPKAMMPGYGKSNNGNKGAWLWGFGVGGNLRKGRPRSEDIVATRTNVPRTRDISVC